MWFTHQNNFWHERIIRNQFAAFLRIVLGPTVQTSILLRLHLHCWPFRLLANLIQGVSELQTVPSGECRPQINKHLGSTSSSRFTRAGKVPPFLLVLHVLERFHLVFSFLHVLERFHFFFPLLVLHMLKRFHFFFLLLVLHVLERFHLFFSFCTCWKDFISFSRFTHAGKVPLLLVLHVLERFHLFFSFCTCWKCSTSSSRFTRVGNVPPLFLVLHVLEMFHLFFSFYTCSKCSTSSSRFTRTGNVPPLLLV